MIEILMVLSIVLLVVGRRRPARTAACAGVASESLGRVALLAPLAGREPNLDAFLAALAKLDPAPDDLVLIVEDHRRADPCAERVRALARQGRLPAYATVVSGERATASSQKAANLLAGLEAVPAAEVIVTIDSDTRPGPEWLAALLDTLALPEVTVATGYRWLVPGRDLVSQLVAVWNGAALSVLADPKHAFAWGGATAIRRADLERLGIRKRLARALSTDMAITRAVRAAGGRIVLAPAAVVPSVERPTVRESVRWIVRQLVMFHRSDPRLGAAIGLYHLILAATQVGAALVLAGWGGLPLAGRVGAAMVLLAPSLRGLLRAYQRFAWLGRQPLGRVPGWDRGRLFHVLASPLVTWIVLAGLIASSLVRRVEWRGVRYRIGPGNTVAEVDWSRLSLVTNEAREPVAAAPPDPL